MRLGDDAVLVDQVGNPPGECLLRRIRGAVRNSDAPVRVGEQTEGKVEFFREAAIRLGRVEADTEDLRVLCVVLFEKVPEPGPLPRSTRGIRLGVKPENDLAASKVTELNLASVVVRNLEIGGLLARLEHGCLPS